MSKQFFRYAYARICMILAYQDPMIIMPLGCPPDEYEPEAQDLAERLANGEIVDAFVVQDVFAYWFGHNGKLILDNDLARKIASLCNELKPRFEMLQRSGCQITKFEV